MKTFCTSFTRFGRRARFLLLLLALSFLTQVSLLAGSQNPVVVGTIPIGPNPGAVVLSPDGSFAYVVTFSSGTPGEIDVIDTTKRTLISSTKIDGLVGNDVAISPDGGTLYCLTYNDTLLTVSTATLQIQNTFAVGRQAISVAVSPDGKLVYVPDQLDGTVTVITNNTSVTKINVDQFSVAVSFSPDGKQAYVTSQGSSATQYVPSVTTIDTGDGTVISHLVTTQIPYPWTGMVVSPDGSKVYFGALVDFFQPRFHDQAAIGIFDPATDSIVAKIDCVRRHKTGIYSGDGLALSPDGTFLYVPIYSTYYHPARAVVVIDTATKAIVEHIPVGSGPDGIAISPDGKHAYVTNYFDSTIMVIDL